MFDGLYVEQALHGYSNGHKLLQTSCKLSEQDEKKMLMLSDLSGNEFIGGFERYFTGYSLSDERIVLACTWYAEEMKRPGCVWTHSIIINTKDLVCNSKMIAPAVISLFRRPEANSNLEAYSQTLKVPHCNEAEYDSENLKYLIWCIWGNKAPLVVFDDVSTNLENELIFLFLSQHDLLGGDFAFCTGSFSPRGYDGKIMQFQIAPHKISRSKMLIGEKTFEATQKAVIKNYPLWVKKIYDNIEKDGMITFRKFMQGFSEDFKHADYLASFIKLYVGARADTNDTNLIKLLEMAEAIFDDTKKICNEIMRLYGNQYFSDWLGIENYNEAISFFIKNAWLNTSTVDIRHWITQGYNSDFLGSKLLFKQIVNLDEEYDVEVYLEAYADTISVDKFAVFTDLELEGCSTLISIRNKFALCEEIWKQGIGFQKSIVACLSKQNEYLNAEIIETILVTSDYDLSFDLYTAYENECFPIYWKYLLYPSKLKWVDGIAKVLKKDAVGGVKRILDNLKHRDNLLLLISLVDPYMYTAKQLKDNDIITIYYTIRGEKCSEKENELLAKFLMPFCLMEDYMVGTEIAEFSFTIVNHLLAIQAFPEDEWNKLQKILPEVAYYNNWDRCKRLRKGFRKKGYPFVKKIYNGK